MGKIGKIVRQVAKIVIPLFFGLGLFWYLYRNLDFQEITSILHSGMNIGWVIVSMIIGVISHVSRAYRWRLQLYTLGIRPKVKDVCNAVFGMYAVNLLFPRLGEVWRCGYISKRENVSFAQVLGSVVSDRLSDTIMIGLIALVVVLSQLNVFLTFLSGYPEIEQRVYTFVSSPWLYIILFLLLAIAVVLYKSFQQSAIVTKGKRIMQNLWYGFITIIRMKHKITFIVLTFVIWICYFLQLYFCMLAFDFSEYMGLSAALVMFVMGSISVILPVQGGIGPWHFAVISTMVLYGVERSQAGAFALVAHGSQMIVVILLGLYTAVSIALERRNRKV